VLETSSRTRYAFPLLAYAFAAMMLGTTLPTPIYALYAEELHFSVLTTTVIYATYAGGVLFTLLVFGRWSDAIGRRPVLLAGVACALVSDMIFLFADSVPILLVARVVSGFSAGVFAGTATAAVIEAAPPAWHTRAASVATVANIGALGIGPLLSGLLVEYAQDPMRLSFLVHIVLAVLAAAAVAYAPETSPRTGRLTVQRVSVPLEIRPMFAIAALAAFAGFSVTGLFTAVVPSFLATVVGVDNHAVAGLVVCLIFAVSAVAQVASTNVSPHRAVALGCALLVAGMAVLAVALHFSSLTGVIAAAVVSGIGQGMSFSRGLAAVMDGAPHDRRAEISSTYFVVAYVAISLPVIGEGLATQAWGLRTAGLTFAVAVAVLSSVCLTAILVREARESRRDTTV
jgi:MFS family permease